MLAGRRDTLGLLCGLPVFSNAPACYGPSYATSVLVVMLSTACDANGLFLTDNACNRSAALSRRLRVLFNGQPERDMQRLVLHQREDKHVTCEFWRAPYVSGIIQDMQRDVFRCGRLGEHEQDRGCLRFVVGGDHRRVECVSEHFLRGGMYSPCNATFDLYVDDTGESNKMCFTKRVLVGGAFSAHCRPCNGLQVVVRCVCCMAPVTEEGDSCTTCRADSHSDTSNYRHLHWATFEARTPAGVDSEMQHVGVRDGTSCCAFWKSATVTSRTSKHDARSLSLTQTPPSLITMLSLSTSIQRRAVHQGWRTGWCESSVYHKGGQRQVCNESNSIIVTLSRLTECGFEECREQHSTTFEDSCACHSEMGCCGECHDHGQCHGNGRGGDKTPLRRCHVHGSLFDDTPWRLRRCRAQVHCQRCFIVSIEPPSLWFRTSSLFQNIVFNFNSF